LQTKKSVDSTITENKELIKLLTFNGTSVRTAGTHTREVTELRSEVDKIRADQLLQNCDDAFALLCVLASHSIYNNTCMKMFTRICAHSLQSSEK